MSRQFDILCEIGEGALLYGMRGDPEYDRSFTSRQFGEVLYYAQAHLPRWDRYCKPLRRGHTAGQVLRRLREKGLVERTPRAGHWRMVKPIVTYTRVVW